MSFPSGWAASHRYDFNPTASDLILSSSIADLGGDDETHTPHGNQDGFL